MDLRKLINHPHVLRLARVLGLAPAGRPGRIVLADPSASAVSTFVPSTPGTNSTAATAITGSVPSATPNISTATQLTTARPAPGVVGTGVPYYDAQAALYAALLIDCSGSMDNNDWFPTRLKGATDRCLELIECLASNDPTNAAAIVAYNERAHLVLPFTACARKSEFVRALATLTSGSETNIAAALDLAIQVMEPFVSARRTLLVHLLTDGIHNCKGDPREAARSLKQRGITIDVVGIGGTPAAVDESLLTDIASDHPDGGKRYRFIGEPQRLTEHYCRLAGRLTL